MTAREPSAVEVIAEALAQASGAWPTEAAVDAVLAVIRAMSVQQQAELIGGEVRKQPYRNPLKPEGYVWCEWVRGPLVEVQP